MEYNSKSTTKKELMDIAYENWCKTADHFISCGPYGISDYYSFKNVKNPLKTIEDGVKQLLGIQDEDVVIFTKDEKKIIMPTKKFVKMAIGELTKESVKKLEENIREFEDSDE